MFHDIPSFSRMFAVAKGLGRIDLFLIWGNVFLFICIYVMNWFVSVCEEDRQTVAKIASLLLLEVCFCTVVQPQDKQKTDSKEQQNEEATLFFCLGTAKTAHQAFLEVLRLKTSWAKMIAQRFFFPRGGCLSAPIPFCYLP